MYEGRHIPVSNPTRHRPGRLPLLGDVLGISVAWKWQTPWDTRPAPWTGVRDRRTGAVLFAWQKRACDAGDPKHAYPKQQTSTQPTSEDLSRLPTAPPPHTTSSSPAWSPRVSPSAFAHRTPAARAGGGAAAPAAGPRTPPAAQRPQAGALLLPLGGPLPAGCWPAGPPGSTTRKPCQGPAGGTVEHKYQFMLQSAKSASW